MPDITFIRAEIERMRDHFRKLERGGRAVGRLRAQQTLVSDAPGEPSELAALLEQLPTQQRIAAAL